MKLLGILFFATFATAAKIDLKSASNRNGRIMNGKIAEPAQFPYQVAFFVQISEQEVMCSGALITSTEVLSTAQCLTQTPSARLIFGAHFIRQNEATQQVRTVPRSDFIIHPLFESASFSNDIAVIPFTVAVTINQYVQTIALAFDNAEYFEGETATISGWGLYSSDTQLSDVLRFGTQQIVNNLSCRIRFPDLINPWNLCAMGNNNNAPCHVST